MTGPRVSFYVLPGSDDRQRLVTACRLVEKAWQQAHRVVVLVDGEAEARAFDELLWQFADSSFVPHAVAGLPEAADAPVLISVAASTPATGDVLVNLSSDLPGNFDGYARVAEIIDADDARRSLGRERFRAYRERGIKPETHSLGA